MKSKLAVLLTAMPCVVVIVVASAFGQSAVSRDSQAAQVLRVVPDLGQSANGLTTVVQDLQPITTDGRVTMTPFGNGAVTYGGGVSAEELKLSNHVNGLVRQLGDAKSDSEKDRVKAHLSEALAKQFDQRQKRHEHEIAELEAKVKKLKDLVAKRQENRREIVSKRLDQILRDADGLGW